MCAEKIMPVKVRRVVSSSKRFSESGFDLDLTYIKPNLIAMSFPYRMDEVVRFLDLRHLNHYRVYNLCSERSYDCNKFHMRVITYPCDVNCPPPFELIQQFCEDVSAYLKADDKNVAVVHCLNGVERTGIMICSYLLHDQIFCSTKDVLQFFASARTQNGIGVIIPSQQRYVQYYGYMVKNDLLYFSNAVLLQSLKFNGNPFIHGASCSPYFTISVKGVKTYTSKFYDHIKKSGYITEFLLPQQLPLCGDVTIEFFNRAKFGGKENMFAVCFNTNFVDMHLLLQKYQRRCTLAPMKPKPKRPISTSFLGHDSDGSLTEIDKLSNGTLNDSPLLINVQSPEIKKSRSLTDVHAAANIPPLMHEHRSSSGSVSSSYSHDQDSQPRIRTQTNFQFMYKKMIPSEKQLKRALRKAGKQAGVDITTGFTTVVHKPVKSPLKFSQTANSDLTHDEKITENPATGTAALVSNSVSSSSSAEENLDHYKSVTIILPLSELDHSNIKGKKQISDDFQLHIVLSVGTGSIKDVQDNEQDSNDLQDRQVFTL